MLLNVYEGLEDLESNGLESREDVGGEGLMLLDVGI